MTIEYNVTSERRKELVKAIGEIVGEKPEYRGAPTMAYHIGKIIVGKSGSVVADMFPEGFVEALAERGFIPEDGNVPLLTVSIPRSEVNEDNLKKILDAKGALIRKALGVSRFPVRANFDKIDFCFFCKVDGDAANAYTLFVSALCKMSKQKRVTAKEKTVPNEKYAFRCFLLRLGFIGDEYKQARKILLRNLSGSAAFKNGMPVKTPGEPQ